ncbi:MAG: TIGR00730 family Rossman fold protein [Pirellulales bacterium]|nr:TIGR00730 family Rossman fold protein [Pirellulales bacterium]
MEKANRPAVRNVCVFCGSMAGDCPEYARSAQELGRRLAESGRTLIFGGGQVGLMGQLADAALAADGEVIGVIPQSLATKELLHPGATKLHVVSGMHERKAIMDHLADAVIALPGGFGTLDELFESITWSQLGFHRKPIGLLNTLGYFNPLVGMIEHAMAKGFVSPGHGSLFFVEDVVERMLQRLEENGQRCR